MAENPICVIPDCGKPAKCAGMCSMHYARKWRHGDASIARARPRGICSMDGCLNLHSARGLCKTHATRLKKHGDPSVRLTNKNKGKRINFVLEVASPFTGDNCLHWPFTPGKRGWAPSISIHGKRQVVTRYLCEVRHGPAPTTAHQAAHVCGQGHRGCVNPSHLQWKTPSENQLDKIEHNTHIRGTRSPTAKIDEAMVIRVRSLLGTMNCREIARRLGISWNIVYAIKDRRTWGWLE